MESGCIVEYIDRQKIICAVVLDVKNQRLRLLNENNREVKLSESRLSHKDSTRLDLSIGRDKLVEELKNTAERRKALIEQIDIKELWEVLNSEQEWIDLSTMTEFCFPDTPSGDHESAVVRTFFGDKLYFKFNTDRFFPNSEEKVEQLDSQAREAERRHQIIERGGNWLKSVLNNDYSSLSTENDKQVSEFIEILKSMYLFEKESKFYALGKEILAKAGAKTDENIFQVLVKLGVWDKDENLDLYLYDVPIDFSKSIVEQTEKVKIRNIEWLTGYLDKKAIKTQKTVSNSSKRRDLTSLDLITIDGQTTLDFDDALSIEDKGDHYCMGVHIADVGHFVKKGDMIDEEAIARGSSIYMPDQRIPMLPPSFAEDLCSLRGGKVRPGISTLIKLDKNARVIEYEIVPSLIQVKHQLTYHEVNNMIEEEHQDLLLLYHIAQKFREKRLSEGAVQISLPEINIWLEDNGELVLNRTNRETPGRMLVAEAMIMANWLMARFLDNHGIPAIFRSQPSPKDRLYKDDNGSLFQNWMQRKLLSRFILSPRAEHHSGLGLDAYVTATSPIRKYSDLITQRQIRSIFGLDEPSNVEDIDRIIQMLEQPMSYVSRLQYRRKRYWLLKYLEGRIGEKEEVIVLNKRRNDYQVLIPEYMIECPLPLAGGFTLKAEDVLQVAIQHVNARKDLLSIFIG